MSKVEELRKRIKEWRKQQDMLEDMIEAAYMQIDELEEKEVVAV